MPSIPVAHTAKIALGWTFQASGQQCENIFYLQDPGDGIFANPTATLTTIQAHIAATIATQTDGTVAYNLLQFEDQRTVPYGGISHAISPVIIGAIGVANILPSSVCIAIKKTTAALSRSGRGRWYFPVMSSAHLTSADVIDSTYAAAIVAQLVAFQAAIEGALAPAVVGIVSRQNNGVHLAAGVFERITGWSTTDTNVDSQRRRLVGRGR